MNADNIPDSNYIHIERWMYKFDLSLTEIAILACIHGFCQDGESVFKGSVEYLKAWSGAGRSTVFAALKKMCDMKLLVKHSVVSNGKVYPVYYTVRSRRMYQEISEQRKIAKKAENSPEIGLESKKRTSSIQNSNCESPESGRNNIAVYDLKKAAGEEIEALLAVRLDFLSQKIREFLGCDPFPKKFKQKLNQFAEERDFDDERVGKYICFVADKTRSKNPDSIPALFRSLVFAEDVIADFIMKTYATDKTNLQQGNSFVVCPCCGEKNGRLSISCKKCDFDFSDCNSLYKVHQARQIYNLPNEQKQKLSEELCAIYGTFDIRKLMDPKEKLRQKLAADEIYKKYGITLEREWNDLQGETA